MTAIFTGRGVIQQPFNYEAWAKSPAGIAHHEQQERAQQERDARRVEQQAADKERDAWAERCANCKARVAEVLNPECRAFKVVLVAADQVMNAYALIRVEAEYPDEPKAVLGLYGKHGLKIFLNKKSRDFLERLTPSTFDDAYLNGLGVTTCDRPVRIIAYARSGKSAQGEIIVQDNPDLPGQNPSA